MNKKIVVLGEGYLGSAFKARGYTVLGKDQLEILNYRDPDRTIHPILTMALDKYDIIINCLAKSNTRYCEYHYHEALFANGTLPGILSYWCYLNHKKFVHVSTGCLYDRNDTPQKETDFLAAHCNYTLTKWIGEKNCMLGDLIIRPRLFFDGSNRLNNLLNKINKFDSLCGEMDSVTSTDVAVSAIEALLDNDCSGIFNVACLGYTSMQEIGRLMGLYKPEISIEEIRHQQGLYLVNNIMDLHKLTQYYHPPFVVDEIKRCAKLLAK